MRTTLLLCPIFALAALLGCEADTLRAFVDASAPDAAATPTDAVPPPPDTGEPPVEVPPDAAVVVDTDAGHDRPRLGITTIPSRGAVGTLVVITVEAGDFGSLDAPAPVSARFGVVEVPLTALGPGRYLAPVPLLDSHSRDVALGLVDEGGDEAAREVVFGYIDDDDAWAQEPLLRDSIPGDMTTRVVSQLAGALRRQRSDVAALRVLAADSATTSAQLERLDRSLTQVAEQLEVLSRLEMLTPLEIQRMLGSAEPPTPAEVARVRRVLDVALTSAGLGAIAVTSGDRGVGVGYASIYTVDALEAALRAIESVTSVLAVGLVATTVLGPVAAVVGPIAGYLFSVHALAERALIYVQLAPNDLMLRGNTHQGIGVTTVDRPELCPTMTAEVDGSAWFVSSGTLVNSAVRRYLGNQTQVRDAVRADLVGRLSNRRINAARQVLEYVVGAVADLWTSPEVQQALAELMGGWSGRLSVRGRGGARRGSRPGARPGAGGYRPGAVPCGAVDPRLQLRRAGGLGQRSAAGGGGGGRRRCDRSRRRTDRGATPIVLLHLTHRAGGARSADH